VPLKWRRSTSLGLKEEDGRDTVHELNGVVADKEAADNKGWAGTYPFLDVGSVRIIEFIFISCSFEIVRRG